MIRLEHVLHPGRSAWSLCRRAKLSLYRLLAANQVRRMRREQRISCSCGGELLPFKRHRSYGVCVNCGCYVNRYPPCLHDLKRFYSLDRYWGRWMQLKGAPTIEFRTANDLKDGRIDCWFSLLQRFGPPTGRVIEVGCGHAAFLGELSRRGYDCIGVEIGQDVSEWTRRHTALRIIPGAFPDVELPECDIFLAFDVLEHVHDPAAFLQKAHAILKPGGTAILQQPTIRPEQGYVLDPPLGEDFERMFDDVEHLWIFTNANLRILAKSSGFQILDDQSRWRQCHEILVLRRPVESRWERNS